MKTKYIIPILAAALAAVSCVEESDHYLDGLKVSSSYVTIPLTGGSKTITVEATADWTFDYDVDVDTTYTDPVKGNKTETIQRNQLSQLYDDEGFDDSGKPVHTTWLTVSPASGSKGKTTVTFTAIPRTDTKQVTLYLKSGDQTQNIVVSRVKTSVEEIPVSTVKEVAEGTDGKVYRVKGYCTKIANTNYGNWYLSDASVDGKTVTDLYIYGTVNDSGSYDWNNFNISVGDLVTVEGPRSKYGSVIELVDARFIEVQKALMIADKTDYTVSKESKPFEVKMKQNGETFVFESKSDWLTIDKQYDLTKGKVTVKVTPSENTTGKVRTGKLWFQSTLLGKDKKGNPKRDTTEVTISVTQVAETESGGLADIRAKIAPGSNNTPVAFDYTLTETAVVTYVSDKNIFVESIKTGKDGVSGTDRQHGLLIYSDAVKLSVGQTIKGRVFGEGYSYNGLPEATVFDISLAEVGDAPKLSTQLPKPAEVTLAQLKTNWDDYFCRYISVKNVAVTDTVAATYEAVVLDDNGVPVTQQYKGKWEYKKSTGDRSGKVAEDAEGTNEMTVYVQCKKFLEMKKDKRYDITGTACYNKSSQIYIWDPSQVKEVKAE